MKQIGHSVLHLAKFDEMIAPEPKGMKGRVFGKQARRKLDQRPNLFLINTQYQSLAARKVTIERARADSSCLGDEVEGGRRISGQRVACHIQKAIPVGPCIRTQIFLFVDHKTS